MRMTPLGLVLGLALSACAKDPPPSQYPAQGGNQQQQPYPQQQQPYPQQPQAYPQQTTPAPATPAPAASGGTPTAIPGVTKNADGTCSVTPPSFTGQPAAPLVGPCPPGL